MYSKDLVDSAMRSLNAASQIAQADPARPVLHFMPKAGWMNDINGPLYYKGFYHIFYQIHPFSADWGDGDNMMWGHARSKDLVNWDDLPIAVWPAAELGETSCWSGTSCINANGKPMLFYTKCGPDRQNDPYEQWAMIACDDELIKWQKHPSNPILTLNTHGQPDFSQDWRDPFIFSVDNHGKTFDIRYNDEGLDVCDTKYKLKSDGDNNKLGIHIFLDRSLLEIFVNNRMEYVSHVLEFVSGDINLEIFVEQGKASIATLDAWELTE